MSLLASPMGWPFPKQDKPDCEHWGVMRELSLHIYSRSLVRHVVPFIQKIQFKAACCQSGCP